MTARSFEEIYKAYPEAVWLQPKWIHVALGHPGFCVMRRDTGCELAFFSEYAKTSDAISQDLYEAFVAEAERMAKRRRPPFDSLKAAASGEFACGLCACERDPETWLGPTKWFAEKPQIHAPGCPNRTAR